MSFYDTLKPSSPTLSQSLPPVATTPTRILLNSWNQPKIPVPLHQFHTISLVFSLFVIPFVLGYWLFGYVSKRVC